MTTQITLHLTILRPTAREVNARTCHSIVKSGAGDTITSSAEYTQKDTLHATVEGVLLNHLRAAINALEKE